MQVDLPGGGVLQIVWLPGVELRMEIPEQLSDLQFYIPHITCDRPHRTLTFSTLITPQKQAPRASAVFWSPD